MKSSQVLLAFTLVAALSAEVPTGAAAAAGPAKVADPRLALQRALETELGRSMSRLTLPGFEAPYFIAYTVRDRDEVTVSARWGALFADERSRSRHASTEVRVGDYAFDNTADDTLQGDFEPDAGELYDPGTQVPIDDDADALRAVLWLQTDSRYKEALSRLNRKRGRRATVLAKDDEVESFARAAATRHTDPSTVLEVDRRRWAKAARDASARFKRHAEILDGAVVVQATRETRQLVTSDGTRLITERVLFGLTIDAAVRTDDGTLLTHGRSFYGVRASELPDEARLNEAVDRVAKELLALRAAPVLDPYTGPAILAEEAAGVLFHEVIGHRLEGERLADDAEGQTFRGQVGQRVLPEFLDVLDDPTQPTLGAVSLNGWYRFDDEGVPAEAVTLVEKGVLRSFLTSRRPVAGVPRSNGHGRASGTLDPMARMGTLIVRSSNRLSRAALKQRLLEEARRQGRPFGLLITDITGGDTNTGSYGYQAFRGTPRLVYKVDAKTGVETLVRGVEMVGTPLAAINKILATGEQQGVFNGYCGAESGFVPVSAIAPSLLLSEVELQRTQLMRQRPAVLPAPWQD